MHECRQTDAGNSQHAIFSFVRVWTPLFPGTPNKNGLNLGARSHSHSAHSRGHPLSGCQRKPWGNFKCLLDNIILQPWCQDDLSTHSEQDRPWSTNFSRSKLNKTKPTPHTSILGWIFTLQGACKLRKLLQWFLPLALAGTFSKIGVRKLGVFQVASNVRKSPKPRVNRGAEEERKHAETQTVRVERTKLCYLAFFCSYSQGKTLRRRNSGTKR